MTQGEEKKKLLIDPSLIAFTALAFITGALCYGKGEGMFLKGLDDALAMMRHVLPKVAGAILMAGFVQVLLPGELVVKWIGRKSGFRGIMIACLAGSLTPGGPMISFPMVSVLYRMGANISAVIAYLTSWELLGVQRIIIWDMPIMGAQFMLLRVAASLLLPVLAGLTAQRVVRYFEEAKTDGEQ